MKKLIRIVSVLGYSLVVFHFSFSLSGCRREDVREMTVEFVQLADGDRARVERILSHYEGIDRKSYRWDVANRALTLSYDSMKLAQSNVRYAIDEKGIKVKFPEKTDDHAGH